MNKPLPKKTIRQILRAPLKNNWIAFFLLFSLILNLGIWILLFIFIKPSLEPIFLHYNIYFGIDLIGEWYKIYLFPLSGLVIILINYLLGAIMYSSKKILTYLLTGFLIPLQSLLGWGALLVILINQ